MPSESRSPAARDGAAVRQGRDGGLFPVDALDDASGNRNTATDTCADRVILATLSTRRDYCATVGAQYLCIPVPDRTLLWPDHWPTTTSDGESIRATAPLTTLIRSARALPMLIDLRACFEGNRERYPAYSKSSRLWTLEGCLMAYQRLCWRLEVAPLELALACPACVPELVPAHSVMRRSWRHFADAAARAGDCRLADTSSSHRHGLTVARAAFANDHPDAVERSLLVFGDDFAGCDHQRLTGMLAETFTAVHYVGLGAGFDATLIERLRPDVVISCHGEGALRELSDARRDEVSSSVCGSARICGADDHREDTGKGEGEGKHAARHAGRDASVLAGGGVVRQRLFDVETYDLPEPMTVQPEVAALHIDRTMVTRPVEYVEVSDADVLFTGGRWRVATRVGEEIVRRHVDDRLLARRTWRRRLPLPGTSMLLGTSAGAHCYYHWMLELLPKLGMLQRHGVPLDEIDHFLVRRIVGEWQLETLARLGIDRSRIVETERRPRLRCERIIHVDHEGDINLRMHRFVPLWLQHVFGRPAADGERLKLLIVRPDSVGRTLGNVADVLRLLEPAGFIPVMMEGLSVAEQAALFAQADVVLAAHGGALSNMVFCRPGTAIVELFGRHVYPYYHGLAACCGHRYHAILDAPATDYGRLVSLETAQRFGATAVQQQSAKQSFDVPLGALANMLTLLRNGDDDDRKVAVGDPGTECDPHV